MFGAFQNRLTILFVIVAAGMMLALAGGFMFLNFGSVAATANQSIASAAQEARDLVQYDRARGTALQQAAPRLAAELARGGLRISILDKEGRLLGGEDPSQAKIGNRLALALTNLLSVNSVTVEVPGGSVVIGPDPDRIGKRLSFFWLVMFVLFAAVAVVAAFFGRMLVRRALEPLVEVTKALQRLARGEIKPHLIVPRERDELAELTAAYNGAADHVAAALDERRASEVQMSQFIADAGHQLRTPLTVVMGFIEVLRKGTARDPETAQRIFDAMTVESRRMRMLIDKLVLLARLDRAEQPERRDVDVVELAGKVLETFRSLQGDVKLSLHADSAAVASIDELEVREAIGNLVDNALKYAPGSEVDVRVHAQNDRVVVQVADTGPGMSPDEQLHAFDRFYRASNHGDIEGSGIGLAIVKRAVERAGGTIELESRPGAGTRFTMSLPRAAVAARPG